MAQSRARRSRPGRSGPGRPSPTGRGRDRPRPASPRGGRRARRARAPCPRKSAITPPSGLCGVSGRSSTSPSSAEIRASVEARPNADSSSGIGAAILSTVFEESAITTNSSAVAATIFSRVWAPPPPLTSQRSGRDLVGAVDRDVEAVELVEVLDRDAELAGLLLGRHRGGDAADVLQTRGRRAPVTGAQPSSRCRGPPSFRRRRARPPPPRRASSRRRGLSRALSGSRLVIGSWQMAATAEQQTDIDELCINTIRTLSMDAIQKANSGHPGTPMALAPLAYVLWQRYLRFDPAGPDLAEPRPLRALGGPRLDAALLAALPDRRQGGRPRLRGRGHPRGQPRRHQGTSASSTPSARGIPSTAGPPALRPPPARSARASRPASAWRSPRSGRPPTSTGRTPSYSTSTSTRSPATAA